MRTDDPTPISPAHNTQQPAEAKSPWVRGRPIESFREDLRAHFDRWHNRQNPQHPGKP